MSEEIAEAFEDAAKKAEQGLSHDFADAYHNILKDTEDKTGQVADNVADNETNTVDNLTKSAEHDDSEPSVEAPHDSGELSVPEGSGTPGSDEPDLGAGEPGGGQGTEGNSSCQTGGDPVDVVSGQMITSETDLELPGLLPLVLRRAYASNYPGGTLFGPGWSSTLTQRVQIDRQGIHYAGDDAQILHYPVPAQTGQQVYPHDGPRWPLTWDRSTDTILIEDATSGWTRCFNVVAVGGTAALRLITTLSDRNGHRIDYRYGPSGLPSEIRHSGGYRVAVDIVHVAGLPRIEALRLLDGTQDGRGTTLRRFDYDARGRLSDVFNSSGSPLAFAYDTMDRIVSRTDRNGHCYAYEYNASGRVERGSGTGGILAATFAYNVEQRVTSVTNSLGWCSEFHYDEHRHLSSVVDPLGHTVFTEHDRHGQLLSLTDELGRVTRHSYNARGDLVRIDHPDGTHTSAEYGELRLPLRITTPDGRVRRQSYDASGNPTETVDPSGAVTRFCYDEQGYLTSVIDPAGESTTVLCSPAGLPIQVSDPLGFTTQWRRDAFGRVISVTDPLGSVQRFEWSHEGLLTARTATDGSVERWMYDAGGNPIRHIDPLGASTDMEYAAFGLLIARTVADGSTYAFTHDTELRLLSVTNPQGLTWEYSYDSANRPVSETDFNGVTVQYTHDAAGQLMSRSTGPNDVIAYSYDVCGNLVSKTVDGEVTNFGYDPAGRLLSAVSSTCALKRTYDQIGRVATETVNGRTVSVEHDALGRQVYRRTPSGAETLWAYDGAGNPMSLSVSGHSITFEHDGLGLETSRRFGSGLVLSSERDPQHRLTTRMLTGPAGTGTLQRRDYAYNADGYPVTVRDQQSGIRHFDTDPLGRVTAVRADDWSETYTYDQAGNPVDAQWPTKRDNAGLGPRSYQGTLLQRAGRTTFQHDDRGRTTERRVHTLSGRTDIWLYSWDAEDRLIQAITPDGTCWHYQYDPLGRRISKQRLAADRESIVEWTDFSWDGSLLVEQTAHGPALPGPYNLTWDYRGLHPVAQTEQVSLPSGEVDKRFFAVITDLIGSPTHLVEEDGTTAWQGFSNLWGATSWSTPGGTTTPLRFPGQYYDPETRLHYNVHRYYDPVVGRYLVGDPLGLAPGPNPHSYVDNPMVWADPLGLSGFTPLQLGTSQFWSPVDYRGQRIYQRDDLINPGYVSPLDKYGRSNLKRMTQGLAPMGPDDKPVNLHHMLQTQDGPVAEVTQSMHLSQGDYTGSGSYNTLHWKAGSKIPSSIDRDAFADWKSDYWKDRARGLSGGGCGT